MPKSLIKATATGAAAPDWGRWQTQAVRDLAWCCLGQDLMTQLPATSARPYYLPPCPDLPGWLDELDNDPSALFEYLSALKTTRLGVYFEALLRFFWLWHSETEVLAYNKQVMHNNQTLGAFDFLLQQDVGCENPFIHVECAVKFYLGTGDKQWHHWIGPGANDRLDIKLERLLQHQLPLSRHPAVADMEILPGVRAQEFNQAYLLRGYFFSHVNNKARPEYSNPLLPNSIWRYCRELSDVINVKHYNYAILSRKQWLSPTVIQAGQISASLQDIQIAVEVNLRAVFVSVYVKDDFKSVELQRLCVVPDHWPATAIPPRSM